MGSIIFGATNVQLKNILEGIDVVLSDEIMSEINKLYKKFPVTF
jgi:hypothetical protein